MSILSGVSDFFGLDIGDTAIRIVQLHGSSSPKTLVKYAYVPIDIKLSISDGPADQQNLLKAISQLITEAKMSTNNVAVGLPSRKVFTTVADIDKLPANELPKSIRYQADSLIPTPIAESKIDWALLGDSPTGNNKLEILLSSVANSYVEHRLEMLESIGLNVIAFEPDTMAISRALIAADNPEGQVILDMGYMGTNIIIYNNTSPHLTRNINTGTQALVHAAMQNLNIDNDQANQYVFKFGLAQDKLEGQVYRAIVDTVDTLSGEIEKSIKFFNTRYPSVKLERIIVTGAAAQIPEFPLYIANKFGINVEIGNCWRNVSYAPTRQNELLVLSSQFSAAVGLAERIE
jgi:type IV pilus assembly protein PilM